MADDLHYLSATDAIAQFKARKLSPVELMQAVIDRTIGGSLINKDNVDTVTSFTVERLMRAGGNRSPQWNPDRRSYLRRRPCLSRGSSLREGSRLARHSCEPTQPVRTGL